MPHSAAWPSGGALFPARICHHGGTENTETTGSEGFAATADEAPLRPDLGRPRPVWNHGSNVHSSGCQGRTAAGLDASHAPRRWDAQSTAARRGFGADLDGRAVGPSSVCRTYFETRPGPSRAPSVAGLPMAAFLTGRHNLGEWPFSESHAHGRRYPYPLRHRARRPLGR